LNRKSHATHTNHKPLSLWRFEAHKHIFWRGHYKQWQQGWITYVQVQGCNEYEVDEKRFDARRIGNSRSSPWHWLWWHGRFGQQWCFLECLGHSWLMDEGFSHYFGQIWATKVDGGGLDGAQGCRHFGRRWWRNGLMVVVFDLVAWGQSKIVVVVGNSGARELGDKGEVGSVGNFQ